MERVAFLPRLLPGEHLLSAFSRLLLLNKLGNDEALQLSLTGHNSSLNVSAAYHKSYDSLFELFKQQRSREELLNRHTLMGFYRHSMKYQRRDELLSAGNRQNREPLYLPGANLLKNARTWRWCLSCVKEDSQKYGVPYWHVQHQLPTALNCHKHIHEQLSFGCDVCGFQIYDLRGCALPPTKCPLCNSTFHQSIRILSIDALWMQVAGSELLLCESSFLRPNYEWMMLYAVDLITARKWKLGQRNKWSVFDQQQRLFNDWLVETELNEYFVDDTQIRSCKALDIEKTKELPRKVPSLTHLLWLRYLKVHSVRDGSRNGYLRPSTAA